MAAASAASFVVGVQYGKIFRSLIFEDASFRGGIVFEGVMTVQMVGRDVQHDRNVRMKGLDGLELKAADLQHEPGILGRLIDKSDRRSADISAHQRLAPTR